MPRKRIPHRHIHTKYHLRFLQYLPLIAALVVVIFSLAIYKARSETKFLAQQLNQPVQVQPTPVIINYKVQPFDTLESIATQHNVSVNTIKWANNLEDNETVDDGRVLLIPPVTGVIHTVKRGETVEEIAEKYGVYPEIIYDYPANEFSKDRAFPLTPGQILIVPGGWKGE